MNLQTREFDHDRFQELDRGFDFYAPQSMEAPDGRRILIGWMGLPDVEYPTDTSGWAHCLTIPRQLSLKDSKLIQQPVDEMKKLRRQSEGYRYQTTLENRSESVAAFNGTAYELECEISHFDAERFGIEFRTGGEEKTVLQYDRLQQSWYWTEPYQVLQWGHEWHGTPVHAERRSDQVAAVCRYVIG